MTRRFGKKLGHIGKFCRCNCQRRGKAYEEIHGENSWSVNYDPDIVKSTESALSDCT